MRLSKRDLIRLSGIAITAGLAGCQSTGSGGGDERDATDGDAAGGGGTTVREDQEAEIEFVDTHDVNTLPIVRPDTVDDVASVELEITDLDGLRDVAVAYTDDYRDEAVLLAEKTGG